nr:hypothetical protein [uncultured Methanoregula sp.]
MAAPDTIQPLVEKYTFHRDAYIRGQMLDLNKRLQDTSLDHEKTLLSRQVEATDTMIENWRISCKG